MSRHAYLIIAHGDFYTLGRLIEALDDTRNDVYIHINSRAKDVPFDDLSARVKSSKLQFIPSQPVFWGTYSQADVVWRLLYTAVSSGEYAYLHVLSGSDLPIKSQDEIHQYFDAHQGTEFVEFLDMTPRIGWGIKYAWPGMRYWRSDRKVARKGIRFVLLPVVAIQMAMRIDRTEKFQGEIKFGSDFYSITSGLAQTILKQRTSLDRTLKHARAPTEFLAQTALWNSEYRYRARSLSPSNGSNLRHYDWGRGRPYVFRDHDFAELSSSDRLFARKFDSAVDRRIIDKVCETLAAGSNAAESRERGTIA